MPTVVLCESIAQVDGMGISGNPAGLTTATCLLKCC